MKPENDNFKLHSHGTNWFHFRKNLDSVMESFSVTYCHDGTVCMTGDYGCLAWQREFFPEKLDYRFPSEDTHIGYFGEKVVRAEQDQKIHTWKIDLAIDEIKITIDEYQKDNYPQGVAVLQKVYDMLDLFEDGDYGYIQMLESFRKYNNCLDSDDFYHFGRCYTDAFIMKFDMLKSVSGLILECVYGDNK